MLLSKPDLIKYIDEGKLKLNPPIASNGDRINQVSIDLLLGKKFTKLKDPPKFMTSINIDPSLWGSQDLWEHVEQETYLLQPGEFILAQTLEVITIPNDVAGLVEGRSSWGRVGITIHITAPKIDPGFSGTITLEMVNTGKFKVELRAGIDNPAQLMLVKLTSPLESKDLYGTKSTDTFQGQTETIPHKKP